MNVTRISSSFTNWKPGLKGAWMYLLAMLSNMSKATQLIHDRVKDCDLNSLL